MQQPPLSEEQLADVQALPPVLRALLDAELAAGNRIIEVGHSFPAPPIGAYLTLARPVSTRPRASGDGLDFRERRSAACCGEFTDAGRRYFLLETPLAPPETPDMDTMRAGLDATSPRARFTASLAIDYERWHEGTSYDLDALDAMSPDDRAHAELQVASLGDWRDVEALAHLDTPRGRQQLAAAARDGSIVIRMAVLRFAPTLVDDPTRTDSLVRAIGEMAPFAGLTETLDQAEAFHPPAIEQALLRAARYGGGDVAYHAAASLLALHGIITSRLDWAHRPLLLQLNTDVDADRARAWRAVCQLLDIDAAAAQQSLLEPRS